MKYYWKHRNLPKCIRATFPHFSSPSLESRYNSHSRVTPHFTANGMGHLVVVERQKIALIENCAKLIFMKII